MDAANPYKSPSQRQQADARAGYPRSTVSSHIVGSFGLLLGIAAWAEWFLIPILYPADRRPRASPCVRSPSNPDVPGLRGDRVDRPGMGVRNTLLVGALVRGSRRGVRGLSGLARDLTRHTAAFHSNDVSTRRFLIAPFTAANWDVDALIQKIVLESFPVITNGRSLGELTLTLLSDGRPKQSTDARS